MKVKQKKNGKELIKQYVESKVSSFIFGVIGG